MLHTRPAEKEDIDAIMPIIEAARTTMQENGNTRQWTGGYPDKETILGDIAARSGMCISSDDGGIIGYYAFRKGPDPTYTVIKHGQWPDSGTDTNTGECSYHVIHRIASKPGTHGIFDEIMRRCLPTGGDIRIDTHRDNLIMQHLLHKYGFKYCGIIYTDNGDERMAFQKSGTPTPAVTGM